MNWSAFWNGFFKSQTMPGMSSSEYRGKRAAPPVIDLDGVLSGEPFSENAPFVRPEARGGIRDDMAAVYGDFIRALEGMR